MAVTHTTEALVWDVELPDGRPSNSWGMRPRGTVVIQSASHGDERISVPLRVARLLATKLKTHEIDPSSRNELLFNLRELERSCARTRIDRLIDRREYSCYEVRTKLRQDGYPQDVIDECLARACEVGLISDERFADIFISSKLGAGWGMARIERELAAKGVEASSLKGWPYDYLDPEDELMRATELARRRVGGRSTYEKLVRHLCGKGFTLGVATKAARRVLDEYEADNLVDF